MCRQATMWLGSVPWTVHCTRNIGQIKVKVLDCTRIDRRRMPNGSLIKLKKKIVAHCLARTRSPTPIYMWTAFGIEMMASIHINRPIIIDWIGMHLYSLVHWHLPTPIKSKQHNTLIGGWTSMDIYRLNKLTKRKRELRANERDDRPVFVSHSLNIGIKLFQWHRS